MTKQGDLQADMFRAASDEGWNEKSSLLGRLDALLDGKNAAKAIMRDGKEFALPLIYSYLESQYNVRSAFPPFHAKFLADRYLPLDADSIIVDPCSGWGGRLLGSIFVNRMRNMKYIGIDPNPRMTMAYAMMAQGAIHWLNERISPWTRETVTAQGTFEQWASIVGPVMRGKVDLVMTSPPYFSAEIYDTSDTQSARQYPTYDDWREKFYRVLIETANSFLRSGGTFVLNVANVKDAMSLERDAVTIAESCGLKSAERFPYFRLAMPLTPGTRKSIHSKSTEAHRVSVDGALFKYEPVFCFRK